MIEDFEHHLVRKRLRDSGLQEGKDYFIVTDLQEETVTGVSMQMPRYRCHKVVWALKIDALEVRADKSAVIAPGDNRFGVFNTDAGWADRFHGSEEDPGYYVLYEGGYASWSPTKAFEDGYTLIE